MIKTVLKTVIPYLVLLDCLAFVAERRGLRQARLSARARRQRDQDHNISHKRSPTKNAAKVILLATLLEMHKTDLLWRLRIALGKDLMPGIGEALKMNAASLAQDVVNGLQGAAVTMSVGVALLSIFSPPSAVDLEPSFRSGAIL